MATKIKFALISPWNAICGVSEMAYFLVSALEKRGHTFEIFANKFAGSYTQVPQHLRPDTENVHRIFETGFQERSKQQEFDIDVLVEKGFLVGDCDTLIINYQDYLMPNKSALNGIIKTATELNKKVLLLLHDTSVSPDLHFAHFPVTVVCPPSLGLIGGDRVKLIDQGIPEFDIKFDRMRTEFAAHPTFNIISFGMGRNKTHELIHLIRNINSRNVLKKPISFTLCVVQPHQFQEYRRYIHDPLIVIEEGWKEPELLAETLHNSDLCVIWYPEIQGRSTSSAFRFAVGSKVPILANKSNWLRDQEGNGSWIEFGDNPTLLESRIIEYFINEPLKTREQITEKQEQLIEKSGWSKIAQQYEQL